MEGKKAVSAPELTPSPPPDSKTNGGRDWGAEFGTFAAWEAEEEDVRPALARYCCGWWMGALEPEHIVPAPSLQAATYLALLGLKKCRIINVELSGADRFRASVARVRAELSASTAAVYVASPNPFTGTVWARALLEELLALIEETCPPAHLVVDEALRPLTGEGHSAAALSPQVVAIGAAGPAAWLATRNAGKLGLAAPARRACTGPLPSHTAAGLAAALRTDLRPLKAILKANQDTVARWARRLPYLVWEKHDSVAVGFGGTCILTFSGRNRGAGRPFASCFEGSDCR